MASFVLYISSRAQCHPSQKADCLRPLIDLSDSCTHSSSSRSFSPHLLVANAHRHAAAAELFRPTSIPHYAQTGLSSDTTHEAEHSHCEGRHGFAVGKLLLGRTLSAYPRRCIPKRTQTPTWRCCISSVLMVRQQVPPLRIQKGGNASPNKLPQVTTRPLSELSPMALRRNSPSFPQGKVRVLLFFVVDWITDTIRQRHSKMDHPLVTRRPLVTHLTRSGEVEMSIRLRERTTIPSMSFLHRHLRSVRQLRT